MTLTMRNIIIIAVILCLCDVLYNINYYWAPRFNKPTQTPLDVAEQKKFKNGLYYDTIILLLLFISYNILKSCNFLDKEDGIWVWTGKLSQA